MPIYAYKCSSCGHGADVMQKLSDAPLTVCTACGQPTFAKQITAAGFQLKGSGWYATDFKNGSKGTKKDTKETKDTNAGEKAAETTESKTENKTDSKKATDTAADKKSDSSDSKPAAANSCGRGGSSGCS